MRWVAWFSIAICTAAAAQTPAPAPARITRAEPTHEQAREFVRSLLVASPYRISEAARNGEIRYRLSFADGTPWAWPETGEQHVEVEASGDVTLRICAECGRETAPTPDSLHRHLTENPWVESGQREVVAFARRHVHSKDVHRRMAQLRDAVQAHMTGGIDFRRYDSAATALQSRSGDCTEVALLLAALARAQGIPARVAYGIAYSSRFTGESHVFSPHAWVQAWDGQRWRSYDAGLGKFGAGHIALFVGDGSTEGLANVTRATRQLRIVEAVGIQPTALAAPSVNSIR